LLHDLKAPIEKRLTSLTQAGAFPSNERGTTVVRLSDYRSSRRDSFPPSGSRAVEGSASQQGKLAGPPLLPPTMAAPLLPLWWRAMLGNLTLFLGCSRWLCRRGGAVALRSNAELLMDGQTKPRALDDQLRHGD
jgi:hypothetical protein